MKELFAATAILVAGCASMPDPALPQDAPASLAAAETAFAAQSVREGMRAAFLAWLAPDATLFRDGPVNGPALIAASPDPPIILDWRPVHVEVAASGDMGLSTGPWKINSRQDPSAATHFGQFVTVWRREAAGPWRVLVDLGIAHPGAALAEVPLQVGVVPPAAGIASGTIAASEMRFARLARESGDAVAYASAVSHSIRLYREGHAPILGRTAALAFPVAQDAPTAWTLESQETSASGDFGFALGHYGPVGGRTTGHYLRVWRREDDGWRIALDVVNALASR